MSQLRAQGLSRSLPTGRCLYKGLDLEARGGQLLALIGPNGAGKSTLLRDLVGLSSPQSGAVSLDGADLHAMDPRARARAVAYLPQHHNFPYDLRVRELVMLGRAPHRTWFGVPSKEDRKAVTLALELCDAAELAERGVRSLSGGERQRVLLARMLATQASVLVLDEPTTSLDIGHALRLFGLLKRLAGEGRCVVAAVHELDLARRFADRALCLRFDDAGRYDVGDCADILVPKVLDPAFRVQSRWVGDALRFDSESPATPGES